MALSFYLYLHYLLLSPSSTLIILEADEKYLSSVKTPVLTNLSVIYHISGHGFFNILSLSSFIHILYNFCLLWTVEPKLCQILEKHLLPSILTMHNTAVG